MAASETLLGELHQALAYEFKEQLTPREEPVFNKDGEQTGSKIVRASPAVLSAITAFLKNNNVTADVEDNAAMRQLSEALAARRKKKIPQAQLDAAAEAFADRFGGSPLQ